MNWRGLWLALLVAVALWQAAVQWKLRPVHPRDGVLAPGNPVQQDTNSAAPVVHGRWVLTPRARYDVTARILGREDYRFDAMSDLVPEDLALGWGAMSDNAVLSDIEISQGARFYSWRIREIWPIPREEIVEHSANTHIIPADAAVNRQIRKLRVGQVVRMTGFLVDGRRNDGASVRTSLTRSDSGAGACEVMLVEQVEVL